MKMAGVITGDIVASRMLSNQSRKLLYSDLKAFLADLQKEGWIVAFEMFRGDGIQCVANDHEKVLRVALIIRAWFKFYQTVERREENLEKNNKGVGQKGYQPAKQDIRLSVALGEADFSESSLAHSDGEAFYISGEGLDKLKKMASRIIVQTADAKMNSLLEPTILLLDAVLEKWTNNQAETAFWKLKYLREEEIARKIGISQPAVNQRTKTSKWNAIEKLLTWFETTIKERQT